MTVPVPALSRPQLYAIVFIEGFCSLGAEVLALRQLVPHLGSSIIVTAPTIGLFLLALALGYPPGAKDERDYLAAVSRNFLWSAVVCGVISSPSAADSDGYISTESHSPSRS